MRAREIARGGAATEHYAGAARFFLERAPAPKTSTHPSLSHPRTVEFDCGPAVESLVDDVTVARAQLEEQGLELLTDDHSWDEYLWARFRGADDNAYGLTSGPYRT